MKTGNTQKTTKIIAQRLGVKYESGVRSTQENARDVIENLHHLVAVGSRIYGKGWHDNGSTLLYAEILEVPEFGNDLKVYVKTNLGGFPETWNLIHTHWGCVSGFYRAFSEVTTKEGR